MSAERLLPDGSAAVPVHFLFRREGEATYRIACMPVAMELSARAGKPFRPPMSEDPRACACIFCRDTDEFRAEAARCGYQELL